MIEVTTPPTVPADFRALVLDHVKVESGDEEDAYGDLVDAYLDAAIARVEAMSGRKLFTRSLKFTTGGFGTALELPASPVIEVSSVAYVDPDGADQTLDSGAYALIDRLETPMLYPVYDTEWPKTRPFPASVTVDFDAGYGEEPDDVPAPLRQAVMQTVADWMRFAGSFASGTIVNELPESAYRACMSYRREWA